MNRKDELKRLYFGIRCCNPHIPAYLACKHAQAWINAGVADKVFFPQDYYIAKALYKAK